MFILCVLIRPTNTLCACIFTSILVIRVILIQNLAIGWPFEYIHKSISVIIDQLSV